MVFIVHHGNAQRKFALAENHVWVFEKELIQDFLFAVRHETNFVLERKILEPHDLTTAFFGATATLGDLVSIGLPLKGIVITRD